MKRALLLALSAAFVLLAYQNCAKFTAIGDGNFSSSSLDVVIPPSDKIDPNCATSDADACIFLKSPVSQGVSEASTQPIFSIKLTDMDGSSLTNSYLNVTDLSGNNYDRLEGKTTDPDKTSQIMAYYWLNRAMLYFSNRGGPWPVKDQQINVVVGDKLAGFNAGKATIHLKKEENKSMALDAGTAIYFLGQANLHYATNGRIGNLDTGKHNDCRSTKGGCCVDADGCAKALQSGIADYLVGAIFPDDPTLGEAWKNDPNGAGYCGIDRKVDRNASLTANNAFSACSGQDAEGEIHTMGSVYASILWEIRKASGNPKAFDKIYLEHLTALDGGDDFRTAKNKLLQADISAGGQYGQLIRDEFLRRGL